MQLTLSDDETEVLRNALEHRLKRLVGSLGNTDAMSFKPVVRAEIDTLEAIYNRLGCEHETGTMTAKCDHIERPDSPEEWVGDSD